MEQAAREIGRAAAAVVAAGLLWTAGTASASVQHKASVTTPIADAARLDRVGLRLREASAQHCDGTRYACAAPPPGRWMVTLAKDLNAWADGRNIMVSRRMMHFVSSDDELAFVVAHEMAHNLLGHAAARRASLAAGSGRKNRAVEARHMEIAADALAVDLLGDAGFDIGAVAPFVTRSMKGRREHSHSHPGLVNRIEALRIAVRLNMERRSDAQQRTG